MKQGILFGSIIIIVMSFFIIKPVTVTASELQVSIIDNGEYINSYPLNVDTVIWYFDDTVLVDQEIYEYFNIPETTDITDIDQLDFSLFNEYEEINMILIQDGGVTMYEANCPDKKCVKMGEIRNEGQVITCMPHQLVVKIEDNGVKRG
jgi:hypothetical protein